MTTTKRQFQQRVKRYYLKQKRNFPWRKTRNPYHILVSEIMLQQTQTARVLQKYKEWLIAFPTVQSLAHAPLQKVLTHWQGLGYNRRALNLKRTAQIITEKHRGIFPKTHSEVLELPGIGAYTAGAIMAFAYNLPYPIIETNIRTVFIHFFFKTKKNVSDKDILKLVEETLDTKNPREWYYALMDYGVMLKKTEGNASRRSLHYKTQTPFKGSNREIRSNILKAITIKPRTVSELHKVIKKEKESVKKNVEALYREGFIIKEKTVYSIA